VLEIPYKAGIAELLGYVPRGWESEVHNDTTRFRSIAGGRRIGKTYVMAFEAICAAMRPNRDAPPVILVAPTDTLVRRVWLRTARMINDAPLVRERASQYKNHPGDRQVYLRNAHGIPTPIFAVTAKPPSHDLSGSSTIGEGYQFAGVDEVPRVSPDYWHESLRPALADTLGDALLCGSPKGQNFFYNLWRQGREGSRVEGWRSWQVPSWTEDAIAPEEIAKLRATTPDHIFRQEYGAEFVAGGSGVFKYERKGDIRQPERGRRYIGGLDIALTTDYTVLSIHDAQTGEQVAIWRGTDMEFVDQAQRLMDVWRPYNCIVYADKGGYGYGLYEKLRHSGMRIQGITITEQSRAAMLSELQRWLAEKLLTISTDEKADVFAHELDVFAAMEKSGGRVRYEPPSGEHDDCVFALALVAYAFEPHRPRVRFAGGLR
jgi:hypothetical protein